MKPAAISTLWKHIFSNNGISLIITQFSMALNINNYLLLDIWIFEVAFSYEYDLKTILQV